MIVAIFSVSLDNTRTESKNDVFNTETNLKEGSQYVYFTTKKSNTETKTRKIKRNYCCCCYSNYRTAWYVFGYIFICLKHLWSTSHFIEPLDTFLKIKYDDISWKSTIKYKSSTPNWVNEMFVGYIMNEKVSMEVSLHEWRNEWNCKVCFYCIQHSAFWCTLFWFILIHFDFSKTNFLVWMLGFNHSRNRERHWLQ